MEAMWYPCEDLGVIKVEKGMLDDHMPNEVVKAFQHVYQQLVEPVKDSTANQPTYNELVTSENSSEEVNITMLYWNCTLLYMMLMVYDLTMLTYIHI